MKLENVDKKLGLIASIISKGKVVFITLAGLVVLLVALATGNAREALCKIYHDVTGKPSVRWQPLQDRYSHAWLAVEGVLGVDAPDPNAVQIYQSSESQIRFRWRGSEIIKHIHVGQNPGGVWMVRPLSDQSEGWCSSIN